MISIEMRFTAGRYHATPWDRHANEAAVAWPPEPWRLLRTLVAVWHRKSFPADSEPVLESLIEKLASSLPQYQLPHASHSHTRHYMPIRHGRAEGRALVFDGFLRIARDEALIVSWPNAALDAAETKLLDGLLAGMTYLGRAESWVDAARTERPLEGQRISVPFEEPLPPNAELIAVLAPRPPHEYRDWRRRMLDVEMAVLGLRGKALTEAQRTIPERFLDLLRLDTADWQSAGWSATPGTQMVTYTRPSDWDLSPRRARKRNEKEIVTTARFALTGRPLPRAEDAVRVGEWMRRALMSRAGGPTRERVSPILSGRSDNGFLEGHRHAFFLPEPNANGWIDHIIVHAGAGLNDIELALSTLQVLKGDDALAWRVFLEGLGSPAGFAGHSRIVSRSKTWISVTPYLHPWHRKKNFGVVEQIARELEARNTPRMVSATAIEEIVIGGRPRRPVHYHRFRSRRGLIQPDAQGSFWQLEFEAELEGPLALGFGAHFGLGLFGSGS